MPPRRRAPAETFPPAAAKRVATALVQWFQIEARDLPWRRTLDPYAVWVSEIMLQQTQVKTVVSYWERWMRELPTLADLARTPEPRLLKLWEGLGYYTRVRNLKRAAETVLCRHGGHFPRSFTDILELPGVGRYTAGAIGSIAFNQAVPVLDGNVIRVLTRVLALKGDPKAQPLNARLWRLALQLVEAAASLPRSTPTLPRRSAGPCSDLNQSLMELGATVCLPIAPRCAECPVNGLCRARRLGTPHDFPEHPPRLSATARHFVAFIVEKKGSILVQQRPLGGVNAGLWEFPNLEVPLNAPLSPGMIRPFQIVGEFAVVKHTITRYRIRLEAHKAKLTGRLVPRSTRWVSLNVLSALPFSGAHAKLRSRLIQPRMNSELGSP